MALLIKRRLLRLVATCLYGSGVYDARRLRILTFHSVQDHSDNNWHTPVKVFESQMRHLADSGYKTYTISNIVSNWPKILGEKAVAITFDDGLLNNFTDAAGIMQRFGIRATFFISTENIGEQRGYPVSKGLECFKDSQMLNWDDIREMQKSGFEIGSHGHSHDMITKMPEAVAFENIAMSKKIIESELNAEISSFAYPYGHKDAYSHWTREILVKSGFKAACTQSGGALSANHDLLELPRIGIRGYDSLEVFKQKISGCYDFLRLI